MFGADIPVNMAVPGGVVNSRQLSSTLVVSLSCDHKGESDGSLHGATAYF